MISTFRAVCLALHCALLLSSPLFLRPYISDAFVPPIAPRQASRRAVEFRLKPSSSALGMGASLCRTTDGANGDEYLEIGSGGLKLGGCVVEESGGRYYCTADKDDAVSIGGNFLTAGVRYLLNEGMTISIGEGEEYAVKIEGGAPTGDAAMAMMFSAMKAGFANAEDDE